MPYNDSLRFSGNLNYQAAVARMTAYRVQRGQKKRQQNRHLDRHAHIECNAM